MKNHREAAYALLRVTLGVIFLFYGIGKFMGGIGNFAGGMNQHFAGKLPSALVLPFAYALPFLEVIIGALLVLGLFQVGALILAALTMLGLVFGTVMLGDAPTVAHNLQYAFVIFLLLYLAEHNGYSVDRLRRSSTTTAHDDDLRR